MEFVTSAIERAFQIAKSGNVIDVTELKKILKKEGFGAAQVAGRSLAKQLKSAIKTAREERNASQIV
jgi:hypothetical protein